MLPEFKGPSSFSLYDITGYLLPGLFFFIVLLFDYDMGRAMNYYFEHKRSFAGISHDVALYKLPYLMSFLAWDQTPADFKLMPLLLLLLLCYLLGHVIGAVSSIILEKMILSNTVGYPDSNLFRPLVERRERHRQVRLRRQRRGGGLQGWWAGLRFRWRQAQVVQQYGWRWLSTRYCRPLDTPFINEFKLVMNKRFGYAVRSPDYFWLCYADVARHLPAAHQRVHHFVNLYGFTRNTSMTFLLYILLRLFSYFIYRHFHIDYMLTGINRLILAAYLGFAFVLFLSYLKLYRRQTVDLFYAFFALHTTPSRVPVASTPE